MNGTLRSKIKPGLTVDIVLKKDQATGQLTRGIIKDILTNSPSHPHGIKVRLQDGQVGRVKAIIAGTSDEVRAAD
ncbi:YwbE family protein [Paenibacillus sp. YSY-4.3]